MKLNPLPDNRISCYIREWTPFPGSVPLGYAKGTVFERLSLVLRFVWGKTLELFLKWLHLNPNFIMVLVIVIGMVNKCKHN